MPYYGLQPLPKDGAPLVVDGRPVEARFAAVADELRDLVEQMRKGTDWRKTITRANPVLAETLAGLERERANLLRALMSAAGPQDPNYEYLGAPMTTPPSLYLPAVSASPMTTSIVPPDGFELSHQVTQEERQALWQNLSEELTLLRELLPVTERVKGELPISLLLWVTTRAVDRLQRQQVRVRLFEHLGILLVLYTAVILCASGAVWEHFSSHTPTECVPLDPSPSFGKSPEGVPTAAASNTSLASTAASHQDTANPAGPTSSSSSSVPHPENASDAGSADAEVHDDEASNAALAEAEERLKKLCKRTDLPAGSTTVKLIVEPSGRVRFPVILDPPFAGSFVPPCITSAFRNVQFPVFSGPSINVRRTIRLP